MGGTPPAEVPGKPESPNSTVRKWPLTKESKYLKQLVKENKVNIKVMLKYSMIIIKGDGKTYFLNVFTMCFSTGSFLLMADTKSPVKFEASISSTASGVIFRHESGMSWALGSGSALSKVSKTKTPDTSAPMDSLMTGTTKPRMNCKLPIQPVSCSRYSCSFNRFSYKLFRGKDFYLHFHDYCYFVIKLKDVPKSPQCPVPQRW